MDIQLPNTLTPGTTEETLDRLDLSEKLDDLDKHIKRLRAQEWILYFAFFWEQSFPEVPMERFTLDTHEGYHGECVVDAAIWIEGRKISLNSEEGTWQGDSNEPSFVKSHAEWIYEFECRVYNFPLANLNGHEYLVSKEGFTLSEWRDLVLHFLMPEQRAHHDQEEISKATPTTSGQGVISRL